MHGGLAHTVHDIQRRSRDTLTTPDGLGSAVGTLQMFGIPNDFVLPSPRSQLTAVIIVCCTHVNDCLSDGDLLFLKDC